ncbi:hypothetical protein HK23_09115 [Acetobacter malorum]|uniref:Uncharacterized protein n=1 Tax=Acetobacter malorum TaxID=178901 RepID=A0A1Y3GE72_9PROT|nr:hypothetical protein HK23_09115 [Acetobacter malorum]
MRYILGCQFIWFLGKFYDMRRMKYASRCEYACNTLAILIREMKVMPVTINRKKTVRVWHRFIRAKGQYYELNRTNVFIFE